MDSGAITSERERARRGQQPERRESLQEIADVRERRQVQFSRVRAKRTIPQIVCQSSGPTTRIESRTRDARLE